MRRINCEGVILRGALGEFITSALACIDGAVFFQAGPPP